jgi:hypothetical protein
LTPRRVRRNSASQPVIDHHIRESAMFVVREVMYCKPGKVRPLVDKFKTMNEVGARMGMPKMRIMTDFCAWGCRRCAS